MAQPNGTTTTVTSIKWRKEYRHYRASRCRLYVCMIILMVFIALSVICVTFLFRNSFYFHPNDYELSSGEMRVVQVSTLFCESIVLKSASFKRKIIVVSPPLTRRAAQNKFMSTDVVLLRRDRTWYRSFYLLKGSTVGLSVISQHSINVYWLKGRKILDKWTDQMNEDLKESSKRSTDIFTGTRMAETFTVNEDNNYYLGITSIAGDAKYSEIFVNINISRIVYDFRSHVTSCNARVGDSCQVKLRFNSRDTAVIAVTHNVSALRTHDVWVTWYCKPRIWFYCAVFVGSFLITVLLISFVYCCIMWRVKKRIREWKPHVPVRSKRSNKENDGTVTLQSINYVRASILDDNHENVLELTPLRLAPARDTCQENNKPDTPNAVSNSTPNCCNSVDGVNYNIPTGSPRVMSFNDTDVSTSAIEPEETAQWRRTPSPRWSTFLQDEDYNYEECVTDFRESPTNTLDSIKKASEDDSFENELMDRLQNLATDDFIEYDGPVETDIDNYTSDSETNPFLSEASGDDEHMMTGSGVVLRQKDKRKELRWEPRLSVVTEI